MTSTITHIAEAIKTVGQRVNGIQSSIYPPPPGISSAALPCLYVITGDTDFRFDYNENCYVEYRAFQIRVAVFAGGEGEPHQVEKRIPPLIQEVVTAFINTPRLAGLADVRRLIVLGDSGPIKLEEYGGKFLGFGVSLQVETVKPKNN